jgi:acetylornithine deacetylase/succinyl-diaminopimelate desuccinylase-like protein
LSETSEKILSYIRENEDELVQLALDLGNIYAPSGREGFVGEFLISWLQRQGFSPEKIGMFQDRYSVVARIRGEGVGYNLIFNSHMDAAISRDDTLLLRNPDNPVYYSAWRDGDKVWGAAVVNDRGPMACFLMAAKALKRAGLKLKGDVILTMVPGEIGVEPVDEFQDRQYLGKDLGARYMINHGVVGDYALVAEATNFSPLWVEAGKAFFKVTVLGGLSLYTPYLKRSSDGSDSSPNAIVRATKVIEAVEEWGADYEKRYTKQYAGGKVVPKVSVNAIRSGQPYKFTRTPEICHLYLDIRLNPDTQALDVQRELEQVLKKTGVETEIKLVLYRRGYEARNIQLLAESVKSAHESLFSLKPSPPDPPLSSMWRDIIPFIESGIPSLSYGPGAGLGGGNTFFTVKDMIKASSAYAIIAMDICQKTRSAVASPERI